MKQESIEADPCFLSMTRFNQNDSLGRIPLLLWSLKTLMTHPGGITDDTTFKSNVQFAIIKKVLKPYCLSLVY